MSADLVVLDHVSVAYDGRTAVSDVCGSFRQGSLTAIVGPNGAGKSSLLKTIAGVHKPASGRITWTGLTSRDAAFLAQAAAIDDGFPISVADVVMMGLWRKVGAFGRLGRKERQIAADALAQVGLEDFAARPFGALSAGQRQRVLFARLVAADSPLILLDEPFTALDARTTDDLLRLVQRWHNEGRTVIAVLHDFAQVRQHFPQSLILARRVVAWGETQDVLTADSLRQARVISSDWGDDNTGPSAGDMT